MVKEYPLLFGKARTLVGIVSYKDTFTVNRGPKTGVLLLNSGLIHRIGPSRLYVRLARQLAELGFVVLRFDISGIGDSLPRTDALSPEEVVIEEAGQAMDYLQQNRGAERFVLIGACAGAAGAFLIAEADSRIVAAVMVNPLVPRSNRTSQIMEYNYYVNKALFNKKSWLKLITMRSDLRSIWNAVSLRSKRFLIPNYLKSAESIHVTERLNAAFDSFQDRKVNLLVISSANEIGHQFLRELLGRRFLEMEDAGLIKTVSLEKTDHNITPINSQNKVIRTISEWGRSFLKPARQALSTSRSNHGDTDAVKN